MSSELRLNSDLTLKSHTSFLRAALTPPNDYAFHRRAGQEIRNQPNKFCIINTTSEFRPSNSHDFALNPAISHSNIPLDPNSIMCDYS
jgi:hypothetical protein